MSVLSGSAPTLVGDNKRGVQQLLTPADRRYTGLLRFWEDWLSFALLSASQFVVAFSIARANWVDEMPALPVATGVGLVVGTMLARLRIQPAALFMFGLMIGFTVTVGMVMQTMELSDPVAGDGILERWIELWGRMGDWLSALFGGGVSSDPLPFVLLMVFVVWFVPYFAAWAVFRWQNAWLALVPAGVALLTNISYLPGKPSFEFALFLFAAILLFARIHLLRTVHGWQGLEIAIPYRISLAVVVASAWVGVMLILAAWVIPTGNNWSPVAGAWNEAVHPITDRLEPLGQVFIGIDAKRSQTVHQFEGALPLQGRVKLDDEPMYIVIAPMGAATYLRSNVFDKYDRSGWRLSDTEHRTLPGTTVELAKIGTPETRTQVRQPMAVEVFVESPLGNRRLLAVGDPLTTDIDADLLTGASIEDLIGLRPSSRISSGDNYTTVGAVSTADAALLVTAGTDYPDWVVERYLQLPDSLPERVGRLAVEVIGDNEIPYVVAFRVELYLRRNYAFDLKVDDQPPLRDPVDFFLFESRGGYFDHHASAMAVMLRTVGIPARIAVGFVLDDSTFDEETRTFILSEADSWAWPQVYFPGFGWIDFNPTPMRGVVSRPGSDGLSIGGSNSGASGGGEDLLDFEDIDQLEEQLRALQEGRQGGDGLGNDGLISSDTVGVLIAQIIAVIAAGAVLLLIGRGAWAYPYRGLNAATARWAKIQRLSGWAGIDVAAHRTPLEAADQLKKELDVEEPLELLARTFTRERYGLDSRLDDVTLADGEQDARADTAYQRVRNRLVREVLLRWVSLKRHSS